MGFLFARQWISVSCARVVTDSTGARAPVAMSTGSRPLARANFILNFNFQNRYCEFLSTGPTGLQ